MQALATWRQAEFVIGTHWDPCLHLPPDLQSEARGQEDVARFQAAIDAHFNLLTGFQDEAYGYPRTDHALRMAARVGLDYLTSQPYAHVSGKAIPLPNAGQMLRHFSLLEDSLRTAHFGYNIAHEPNPARAGAVKDWIEFLKTNDPQRLAFFPTYRVEPGFEAFLRTFHDDPNPLRRSDVVAYDQYPFKADGTTERNYFSALHDARLVAGERPVWVYPMSAGHLGFADPTAAQLRFMAFCPLAYGVKGIIWFTYERPVGYRTALLLDCDEPHPPTWTEVSRINHYLADVVGPVVMGASPLGAYHKSERPGLGPIPAGEFLFNAPCPLSDIRDPLALAGVFRSNESPSVYYLLVVNKDYDVQSQPRSMTVELCGNRRGSVHAAPSVFEYHDMSPPDTTFRAVSCDFDPSSKVTRFRIRLAPGEGRLFRLR